jgi:hypothetical protein
MDEETRALLERRALKLSQRTKTLSGDQAQPVDRAQPLISAPPKKRAKILFESETSEHQNETKLSLFSVVPPVRSETDIMAPLPSIPGCRWFLSFANEFKKEAVEDVHLNDDFLEVYGPKTWKDIYEFSERVTFVNGPRNQFRSQKFSFLLDSLKEYVENWKTQTLPLMLQGETGTGKTRCLQLLGKFLEFDCIFLHDIFLDAMSREELKERLAGLGSRGLNCSKKLWVVEHYDTLSDVQKTLLHGAFPGMMKTGPIVCTSWMTSSQPSARFTYLEFLPWANASKTKFLTMSWSPDLKPDVLKRILRESGENIASAYALAQLWTSTTQGNGNKVHTTQTHEKTEDIGHEDTAYIPVNLRTLMEESFSDRWCPARSLALEAGEPEITVQLLQEMIPMALVQGRCRNDLQELSRSLDFFSTMDSTVGYNAGAYKAVMEKRLLQNSIKSKATFSLEKFNSGSLLPIPQSFISRSKGTSTRNLNRETIQNCRGGPADTRSWSEDIQLFLQASKKPWKSPFSIK